MSTQPQRNEPCSYAYPWQRLVAILDDRTAVEDAFAQLREMAVDVSGVCVLSGPEGGALLDRHRRTHGPWGRLRRRLHRASPESDSLDVHDQALRDGGHVMYVPAQDKNRRGRIAKALLAAGGHHLVYFARFTTETGWT